MKIFKNLTDGNYKLFIFDKNIPKKTGQQQQSQQYKQNKGFVVWMNKKWDKFKSNLEKNV